ncbi:MAG: hypothetical protein MUE74_05965 [Bacteroidales bacterium]|nr:hypothetical protein [Bacteroidales bacterium]
MTKQISVQCSNRGKALPVKALSAVILVVLYASALKAQKASFRFDNLERKYHVYSPPGNNRYSKPPLVIVLHGRGGTGESMALVTRKGFNRLADRDGFIVAYPDGIELNWNDGRMDEEANDRAHRQNIDDVGFISALIDTLVRDYNIDPGRVYITGMSNGAIMSYRLACELSGRIAAIAPVDGSLPHLLYGECLPVAPVSVLAINNVNDPLVPYHGGIIYTSIRKLNLGMVLSVDESVGFWAKRHRCREAAAVTELPDLDPKDGTRVIRKEFTDCIMGTRVILYSIDGGGHTWPGGLQYIPAFIIGKTCRDIDACQVIWDFFRNINAANRE